MNRNVKIIIAVFMFVFGLFLASNIIVIGDDIAAVEMHEDLYPSASASMIQGKVLNCFIVGILYMIGSFGVFRKSNKLLVHSIVASLFFISFYILEIILWSACYPVIWTYFGIMGGINILLLWFSFYELKIVVKSDSRIAKNSI